MKPKQNQDMNNFVTMGDSLYNETILLENVSFYDAFSLVADKRGLKDGNFYRIGTPYNYNKQMMTK